LKAECEAPLNAQCDGISHTPRELGQFSRGRRVNEVEAPL
jgi:hypothetical protein